MLLVRQWKRHYALVQSGSLKEKRPVKEEQSIWKSVLYTTCVKKVHKFWVSFFAR